jgi:RHS repeat-associated protein
VAVSVTKALERDATGCETRWKYNEANLPTEMVDAAGQVWKREYERRGMLVRCIDPLGNSYYYWHDSYGNRIAVEDPLGRRMSLFYDSASELIKETDYEGFATLYEVDDLGRVRHLQEPKGEIIQMEWNECSHLISMRSSSGSSVFFEYDGEGNPTLSTDEKRHVSQCRYGGFNKPNEYIDSEGNCVCYLFDKEENLVGVINEFGECYQIDYDLVGNPVREVTFDGRKLEFRYDRAGNCVEQVNGRGRVTKIEQDKCGRITRKQFHDGSSFQYEYDPVGQLVKAVNAECELLLERNELGCVVREKAGDVTIENQYDALCNRVSRVSSLGQRVRYDYDGNRMLRRAFAGKKPSSTKQSSDEPDRLLLEDKWGVSITRDPLGYELEKRFPAVVAQWNRDSFGRPLKRAILRHDTPIAETLYRRHPNGDLNEKIDSHHGLLRYDYDTRGYLRAAQRGDGVTWHRIPDEAGNVYSTPDRSDCRYDQGGVLIEKDGTHHKYDKDKQLSEKIASDGSLWCYSWDGAGQLSEIVCPDGSCISFGYDALGRRVRKTVDDTTIQFVWDGDDLLHECFQQYQNNTWIFEPKQFAPLALIAGESYYNIVTDDLGVPTHVIDESGEVVWDAQLDIYGKPDKEVERVTCPFRWPGQYEDTETELYYNRFRYYDPFAGRYLNHDPIGIKGGINLFAYVFDPLTQIDPYGLDCHVAQRSNGPNGLTVGRRISQKQALSRLRRGLDVFADTMSEARSLAKRALRGKPMQHGPHGAGYFPHFHPNQHANSSHVFYP